MEKAFMTWRAGAPSFDIIGHGLFIGILAGISEAAIVRFILDIFGVFDKTPIFG
ncbi:MULTISPECIES: hypothetical protein [unclassified Sulfuricurvum]|uniref:hypothetical protein n=1 Tax=unclassified Sulfuricurvum TaxID=2632390 RepID=UPI00029986BD|nr:MULTISPECIES: hypothetical protein [unclassified Sulfuricurvum]AFV97206.1 hypothetical protein B649_04460 [Candidatus Sulfuricurvum sp. RIFRC-1]